MTDKTNIEDSLAKAIDEMTPDILDDLMKELDLDTEPKPTMGEVIKMSEEAVPVKRRARKRWTKAFASCAAALLLVIGGAAFLGNNDKTLAVVGLDVNPSVEMSINNKEEVVSVEAVNDDGTEILKDLELKGTDVDVACNALVGAMLTQGYLTDTSNGLLVSVKSDNEERGKEIENRLSGSLNSYLENSEIAAAIIGQYVGDDEQIEAFARDNGISLGKAWLINELVNTGNPKLTTDSLLKLSTQDLILLVQNKGIANEVSYGQADTSKYIGEEKALAAALGEAGISEDQASNVNIDFDCDDGVIVYEVEFYSGGHEYDYEIDANSGKVISYSVENELDDDEDEDDDDDDDDDDYDEDDDD